MGSPNVLTIPPRHPFIDAVTPASATRVAIDRTVGWEPDPVFEPDGIASLGHEIDLVHVHFSYDHLDGPAVSAWLSQLRAHNIALVITVHDLRNPHHSSRDAHDAVLNELTKAAAVVITLTEGAATEIAARFGVNACVIPHPALVDPLRTESEPTEEGLVLLHLKSLRTNLLDPLDLVESIAAGAHDAGGRLRVDLHDSVVSRPELKGLTEIPGVEVMAHPQFSHLELEAYLRRGHVSVLPHRWGTHSGWLELARDLGTRIVAPDCGHYADQWSDVVTYTNNEVAGLDQTSLHNAVSRALQSPPPQPADPAVRQIEAESIRRAHEMLYADLTS